MSTSGCDAMPTDCPSSAQYQVSSSEIRSSADAAVRPTSSAVSRRVGVVDGRAVWRSVLTTRAAEAVVLTSDEANGYTVTDAGAGRPSSSEDEGCVPSARKGDGRLPETNMRAANGNNSPRTGDM